MGTDPLQGRVILDLTELKNQMNTKATILDGDDDNVPGTATPSTPDKENGDGEEGGKNGDSQ